MINLILSSTLDEDLVFSRPSAETLFSYSCCYSHRITVKRKQGYFSFQGKRKVKSTRESEKKRDRAYADLSLAVKMAKTGRLNFSKREQLIFSRVLNSSLSLTHVTRKRERGRVGEMRSLIQTNLCRRWMGLEMLLAWAKTRDWEIM